MELQKRLDHSLPERKGHKRKLEEEFEEEREISVPTGDAKQALLTEVSDQVEILNSTFSWKEADRAAAKRATHVLAELAKNGIFFFFFFSPETPFRSLRVFTLFLLFRSLEFRGFNLLQELSLSCKFIVN